MCNNVHFKGESASQNVGTPATHAWEYHLAVTVVALSQLCCHANDCVARI